jgi:hypothetical protein
MRSHVAKTRRSVISTRPRPEQRPIRGAKCEKSNLRDDPGRRRDATSHRNADRTRSEATGPLLASPFPLSPFRLLASGFRLQSSGSNFGLNLSLTLQSVYTKSITPRPRFRARFRFRFSSSEKFEREVRSQKPEARSQKPEARSQKGQARVRGAFTT